MAQPAPLDDENTNTIDRKAPPHSSDNHNNLLKHDDVDSSLTLLLQSFFEFLARNNLFVTFLKHGAVVSGSTTIVEDLVSAVILIEEGGAGAPVMVRVTSAVASFRCSLSWLRRAMLSLPAS